MTRRIAAILVHLLTASGAVCGLFALYFAAAQDWSAAFLWLGIAVVIDGIDGPLARRLEVSAALPRFSGTALDETVDFLNYCIIPAFILVQSGMFRAWLGLSVAALVVLTSLFHFADKHSKTADGYFVGFPVVWNVVCFYFFVFGVGELTATLVVLVFCGLTFVPLKWVHPLRVRRLRALTCAVMVCWAAAAIAALAGDFPSGSLIRAAFVAAAIYMLILGLARSFSDGDIADKG